MEMKNVHLLNIFIILFLVVIMVFGITNTVINYATLDVLDDQSLLSSSTASVLNQFTTNTCQAGTNVWTETQPVGFSSPLWNVSSSSLDGSHLIAGVGPGRLYISSNYGKTWTETRPAGDVNRDWQTTSSNNDGKKLIAGNTINAGTGGRLYISSNSGATWTETRPAGDVDRAWFATSSNFSGTKLIAGALGDRLYIYRSCNSCE